MDRLERVQRSIDTAKMERDFLVRRLLDHEPSLELLIPQPEPKYKKRKNSDSEASSITKPIIRKKQLNTVVIKKHQNPQSIRLPAIMTTDGITLYNYGKIVPSNAYHTDSVIYPVGYKISRVFNGSNYICRILDNGPLPLFEIYNESNPTIRFTGSSADDVHSELLQAFESSSIIMPDGDRFFGLKNKNILDYLSQQPSAKKLTKFNKIKYENFFFDDNARFMSSSVPDHIF